MRPLPVASLLLASCLVVSGPALAQEPSPAASTVPASPRAVSQAGAAPASDASVSGFKGFVRSLGRDLKNLPSLETALTLGIGGGLALASVPADKQLTHDVMAVEPLEETLDAGAVIGSGWVQVGGALGTLVLGHVTASPRMQVVGSDLVRAQLLNAAFTQGLKHAVNRERPDGAGLSFPSGHASATFASAAVLERHFGWKVGLISYAVAGYVATSRLSENKHYASDVIFGSALGMVSGRTVSLGHSATAFAVAPVAVPGGVAITVTKTAPR